MSEFTCPQPGCGYVAKTKGAITQHVNREHGSDPLTAIRNGIPGAPRPGGALSFKPLKAAPSGIPSIDYAIGIGGVPRAALVEVFGPSKSGKTFTALTFSSYAQRLGQRAGYMNAEKAPMETFLQLIPGLDVDALEYGEPPEAPEGSKEREIWDGTGEATLEASRRMIASGQFGVWTIDSVHSLTPRQALGLPIGSTQAQAALARMMSQAVPILEHEIHRTNTTCIFVNHVKEVPGAARGRNWSKPGGSALDYYCSVQLEVRMGAPYYRISDGRRIGHVVKVRVHKSKVALPHATAEYDLFYGSGKLKDDPRTVEPGIDILSSWVSVLKESKTVVWAGNKYVDPQGEVVGASEADLREVIQDQGSSLSRIARELVYPERYQMEAAA